MTRRLALTYDRDLIGYGANPPDPRWPGGAPRHQLRDELRGGLGAFRAGWRGLYRGRPDRVVRRAGRREGARSRRRRHVRLWQPRRFLEADAAFPGARPAADRVRLRARDRTQSRGRGGDLGPERRRLQPWLALDQAL